MGRQQKPETEEASVPAIPSKSLFERVAGYLDANDWRYEAVQEKSYFDLKIRIRDAIVRVIIDVNESEGWRGVKVYSVFPTYVPEARRTAVADSINRINYKLNFGNLELDPGDGEIRIRTSIETDALLGDPMIERAFTSSLNSAERYFAPLMAVSFGNAEPATVLDLVPREQDATLQ